MGKDLKEKERNTARIKRRRSSYGKGGRGTRKEENLRNRYHRSEAREEKSFKLVVESTLINESNEMRTIKCSVDWMTKS